MLSVLDYAVSRGISEVLVRASITRLGIVLEVNPADRRQRLLSPSQVLQLDETFVDRLIGDGIV